MIAAIADEARVVSLWESTHATAVAQLIDALDSAGIESVLMKGTALAYSVHEEPAARRRGDSDLLVRPDDLEQARLIFEANGWDRAEGPHGVSYQEAWLHKTATHFEHAIDLHWEPSDSAVIQKALTLHDFFDHKRPLPRLSDKAWRSDLAVTMIHETINQKWHISHGYLTEEGKISGARRLIWSVDFDVMSGAMNGADWERLLKLCEARKFGPLVAQALRGAESDLGTIVPEERVRQLEQMPLDPAIAAFFETTDKLSEFWLNLRSARGWGERVRMLRQRAFPSRDYLLDKYPQAGGWPTPFLQGRLMVETAGRVLRKVTAS